MKRHALEDPRMKQWGDSEQTFGQWWIQTNDTSNPAILQEKETISTYEGSGGKKQ